VDSIAGVFGSSEFLFDGQHTPWEISFLSFSKYAVVPAANASLSGAGFA